MCVCVCVCFCYSLGANAAKASAREANVSKMIDLSESAVKLLKPKTTPHTISGGDRWPALSRVQPRLNYIWSYKTCGDIPYETHRSKKCLDSI